MLLGWNHDINHGRVREAAEVYRSGLFSLAYDRSLLYLKFKDEGTIGRSDDQTISCCNIYLTYLSLSASL